jgi:DNA-binding MarR family transcriptional regulator
MDLCAEQLARDCERDFDLSWSSGLRERFHRELAEETPAEMTGAEWFGSSSETPLRALALAEFASKLRRYCQSCGRVATMAGMYPGQYELLLQITANPETLNTVTQVAGRLGLKLNSTAELVDRCERQGLVTRRQDSSDRRRTRLLITPEGQRRLAAVLQKHAELITRIAPGLICTIETVQQLLQPPQT